MRCEEFEIRLNELLDARAAPEHDAQLASHCEECPPCRTLLAAERRMLELLAQAPLPTVAADFTHSVVKQSRSSSRSWRQYVAFVLAASLLIAVGLRWISSGRVSVPANGNLANAKPDDVPLATGDHNQSPLRQPGIAETNGNQASSYLIAAQEARQTFSDAMLILPTTAALSAEDTALDNDADISWSADVAECIEPLTDSTSEAIDFLLSVLPSGVEAEPAVSDGLPPHDGA